MAKRLEVYKCEKCGKIVEVLNPGPGTIECCGTPMKLMEAGVADAAAEKHVPFVEKTGAGFNVRVGSVEHPMLEKHFIEWIELITEDGGVRRRFLSPDEKPEAQFNDVGAGHVLVRAYCNLHGLWQADFPAKN